jgi:hypothetical protein
VCFFPLNSRSFIVIKHITHPLVPCKQSALTTFTHSSPKLPSTPSIESILVSATSDQVESRIILVLDRHVYLSRKSQTDSKQFRNTETMKASWIVLVPAFALTALAQESYAPVGIAAASAAQKRQAMSCEQTYGTGSVTCGGTDSTFCYNPSLNQVS